MATVTGVKKGRVAKVEMAKLSDLVDRVIDVQMAMDMAPKNVRYTPAQVSRLLAKIMNRLFDLPVDALDTTRLIHSEPEAPTPRQRKAVAA